RGSRTPLGCMLDNWKAFRRQADYGVVLCKEDLIKFCTIEWPTFGVAWPDGGTLKSDIIQAVHGIVTRDGHWDQYPYIDIWQDLVANSPPWFTPVKKPCPPPVIPQAPDYVLPSPLAPPLYPGLGDLDGRRRSEASPPPVTIKEASPRETLIQTQPGPPANGGDSTHHTMPLRETIGQDREHTMIYVPFTTSDLYNWKQQNPPFSEDPAPLAAIFEMLITWATQAHPHTLMSMVLPEQDPEWSHKDGGLREHQRYANAIVQGMKRCIRKTPNWAKLYNIRQEKKENPAAFYEHLCETCRKYTDLDPGDQNGKRVLIPLFIGQSYDDIRRKLQKVEGASGKNIEELLEIAFGRRQGALHELGMHPQ
uniref:Core shell protein Gag P30 domain-containing protein n=1 Tax=Pelusios castaneus TaxID=367368 RepID=A0A8C8RD16_9SAUR